MPRESIPLHKAWCKQRQQLNTRSSPTSLSKLVSQHYIADFKINLNHYSIEVCGLFLFLWMKWQQIDLGPANGLPLKSDIFTSRGVLKTDLKFIQLHCVTAGACSWPQNYLGLFHLVVEKSQLASQFIQPFDLFKAQQICECAHWSMWMLLKYKR